MRERRPGSPALCNALQDQGVCSEAKNSWDLIGGCRHHLLLGWRPGSWGRYVTCPKPHGDPMTQIQPMWTPCPRLSLHNILPTFPLCTTRISPLLPSFKNQHYIVTVLPGERNLIENRSNKLSTFLDSYQ